MTGFFVGNFGDLRICLFVSVFFLFFLFCFGTSEESKDMKNPSVQSGIEERREVIENPSRRRPKPEENSFPINLSSNFLLKI